MFKSRSVPMHLFRGVLGFGLLAIALIYATRLGIWTIVPLAGALVTFRGCPMCWTVGLIETALHRRTASGRSDGSCARG